jgi:hypothetical protein
MKHFIPKTHIKAIDNAIEALFNRLKARFLGKKPEPKQIRFSVTGYDKALQHREDLSMPSIFEDAARAEGVKPNLRLQSAVMGSVEQYLDAHRELAKAKVKNVVQDVLTNAEHAKEDVNIQKVLRTELRNVMNDVVDKVGGVIDTETSKAKNLSSLDAISKVSTLVEIDDPTIAFIGPNDKYCCKDCQRLYFMPDGVTPRVWKLSELKSGYGHHGEEVPSTAGQHSRCRHSSITIMPGFGFDSGGKITYKTPGYDVFNDQRGIK